jgi:hypothetical protein
LEWRVAVANLDNLDDAEKQLIAKQEQVWRALGLADDLLDNIHIAQANLVNKWKNLIATESNVRKGNFGEMASDIFLTGKGYKYLSNSFKSINFPPMF